MRILWVCNVIFPEAAAALGRPEPVIGGWMTAMAGALGGTEHVLAVASLYDGPAVKKVAGAKAGYYLLPGFHRRHRYDERLKAFWREVLDNFKPSLIHIHGTEYAHSLPLLEVCGGIPVVVSIQGLMNRIAKEYYGGIRLADVLLRRTLRDTVRMAGMPESRRQFMRLAKSEEKILKSVRHIIGRTRWDRANTAAVNPALCYHKCNESLRAPFFEYEWTPERCSRHTVFISQATYPIKGLHLLLQALCLLKGEFPDVRAVVAGRDITDVSTWKARLKLTGYGSYIRSIIKRNSLEGRVEFTGPLDGRAMAAQMAGAHVFVLASSIENSPNSLGEAQLVGTPCIASFVGGVPDMVTEGESGLMYNYLEPAVLAQRIARVFRDDSLAQRLSHGGREAARARHDAQRNLETLLGIYEEVASGGGTGIGKG